MNRSVALLLVGLLAVVALAACGERGGAAPPGSASPSLVGLWVSDPTLSQLGEIVHTYDFQASGSYSSSMAFVQADIPKMETSGTYATEDGALVLKDRARPETPRRMRYEFQGDELVLRDSDGDVYRLRRR